MVETEKMNSQTPIEADQMRGDPGVRAPEIGAYRPPNAFYVVPGLGADDIRQILQDCIEQNVMGKVTKEYLETGDDEKPERPEMWRRKNGTRGGTSPSAAS